MDSLPGAPGPANRPIFRFAGGADLTMAQIPKGQLALAGPAAKLDAAHWPVRGDLAHVALAGRCFVPHYAVPMPHVLGADAMLRVAGHDDAEVLERLAGATRFDVLDMAGGWCWGIVASDGPSGLGGLVGYLPHGVLAAL